MDSCLKQDCSQAGWEALYKAKSAELVLYGRALGLSHSEAEDILQETFIALLGLCYDSMQAEHYCLRTFRNRALNYRRGLWRRLRREVEFARWFEPSRPACPKELEAMRSLENLPREQREVVVLKIWHHRTFEQIAALMGASPNTVSGRYRYAMQKLRRVLKGVDNESRCGDTITFLDAQETLARGPGPYLLAPAARRGAA